MSEASNKQASGELMHTGFYSRNEYFVLTVLIFLKLRPFCADLIAKLGGAIMQHRFCTA